MPRRRVVAAREILPDPKFGSQTLAKFINHVMEDGKKSVAEGIVYGAMDRINDKAKTDPVEFFENTLEKVRPMVEVKARRVGGANYQIPFEVKGTRQTHLALMWFVTAARDRRKGMGKPFEDVMAAEIVDAYNATGSAVKKKEDVHRMAEANKAFSHYRF